MSKRAKVNLDLPTGIENIEIATVFTSKPYPVVAVDATTASATVEGARLWEGDVDAVETVGTVTGVELRPILQSYISDPDAVDAGPGDVTAIELKPVLEATEVAPEATEAAGTVTALELSPKLVSQEQSPEAVAPSGTVTGIALN